MITQWGQFRDFVNSKEIGYVFTRKELKAAYTGYGEFTPDSYRNLLSRAGFLSHAGRGKYKLENHIPEGLTMEDCDFLIKGDNLTYVERIHKRKEKREKKMKGLFTLQLRGSELAEIEDKLNRDGKTYCGDQNCCWGPEGAKS